MNNDLISREALKKHKVYSEERHEYVVPVYNIDNAPTVEPVKQCKFCKHCGDEDYCSDCHSDHSLFDYYSRPQGKWVNQSQGAKYPCECSECHTEPFCNVEGYVLSNFCPNCGADMRKDVDND